MFRTTKQTKMTDYFPVIKENKDAPLLPPKDFSEEEIEGFKELVQQVKTEEWFMKQPGITYTQEEFQVEQQFGIIQLLLDKPVTAEQLKDYIVKNNLQNLINCNSRLLCHPYNNTILHLLLANNSFKMADIYLDATHEFLDPNKTDSEGKTLLILAAKLRLPYFVDKLLSMKFAKPLDINAKNDKGVSAIYYSCVLGDIDSFTALNNHQAKYDVNTALYVTHQKSKIKSVLKSVAILADPNLISDCEKGHLAIREAIHTLENKKEKEQSKEEKADEMDLSVAPKFGRTS